MGSSRSCWNGTSALQSEEITLKGTRVLCVRCPWCSRYRRREMNTPTRVQILDETDCISHSTNTLGKGMNPIILLQLWVNSRTD